MNAILLRLLQTYYGRLVLLQCVMRKLLTSGRKEFVQRRRKRIRRERERYVQGLAYMILPNRIW